MFMIVIPEQERNLKKEWKYLKEELKKRINYYNNADTTGVDEIHSAVAIDSFMQARFLMDQQRLDEISSVLSTASIATEISTDKIGIGTSFVFQFLDKEIEGFTLVDELIGLRSTEGFISRNSPFGKKIFGKKIGDEIEAVGTVLLIKENREDYENRLENNIKETRSKADCSSFKKEKTIENRSTNMRIVKAQMKMLQEELEKNKERLKKCQDSKQSDDHEFGKNNILGREINSLKTEINKIENLLGTSSIIKNPSSDQLTIGSEVNLLLNFGDDDIEECHAILVESFVAREAQTGNFISIQSELGKAIYGKKQGEVFSYQLPNNNLSVSGEILTIKKSERLEQKSMIKRK